MWQTLWIHESPPMSNNWSPLKQCEELQNINHQLPKNSNIAVYKRVTGVLFTRKGPSKMVSEGPPHLHKRCREDLPPGIGNRWRMALVINWFLPNLERYRKGCLQLTIHIWNEHNFGMCFFVFPKVSFEVPVLPRSQRSNSTDVLSLTLIFVTWEWQQTPATRASRWFVCW